MDLYIYQAIYMHVHEQEGVSNICFEKAYREISY